MTMKAILEIDGKGPDDTGLYVVSGTIEEEMSQVTRLNLLLSCVRRLTLEEMEDLIGEPLTLRLLDDRGDTPMTSRWDAKIYTIGESDIEPEPNAREVLLYKVHARHRIWDMAFNVAHHIYANTTKLEVVKRKLRENGLVESDDFKIMTLKTAIYLEELDVIQEAISDLEFAERLLREEGINFFFDSEPTGQIPNRLVIADANDFFTELDDPLPYVSSSDLVRTGHSVNRISSRLRSIPAAVEISKPSRRNEIDIRDKQTVHPRETGTVQRRISGSPQAHSAERAAKLMRDRFACQRMQTSGTSDCNMIRIGKKITVDMSAEGVPDREGIVTGVRHVFRREPKASLKDEGGVDYQNEFLCLAIDAEIRPSEGRHLWEREEQ